MKQHDEQLSTKFGDWLAAFAFGTLAVIVPLGAPLAIYWTISGRSELGYACFGAFACLMLVASLWAGRVKL